MSGQDSNVASMSKSEVKRRSLVRGAAWAMPVAAVVAAAPSAAASPPPPRGLNGWVTLSRDCTRTDEFQIDGRGTFTNGGTTDRGIWTFVEEGNIPVSATIVFFLSRSDASFTNSSASGWSNLTRDAGLDSAAPAPGFFAYTTTYTGGWTWFPPITTGTGQRDGAYVANGDPYFLWNMNTCNTVTAYARRSITLQYNETITFTRGPVSV